MKKISFLPLFLLVIVILTAWQLTNTNATKVRSINIVYSSIISPSLNTHEQDVGIIKHVTQPVTTGSSSINEKDILPQILAFNSNEKLKPKQDFKKGEVTPTTLENYLSETPNGFCIQLPSSTNVPTPAVINGSLYLSGGFGSKQYYAFNATTGKNKWAISLDDDGPSSPAIQDGIIVFNTESCTIFACDMVTGKPIWSYYLGDPLMSMPTIANGIVFTAYPANYEGDLNNIKDYNIRPSHVLIAIELKTGKILWQKWIDSDVMSAPVAKDDLLYVTTFSGALYKVKQRTGDIIEAKAMRATSAPVFSNTNEIVVSRRNDDKNAKHVSEAVMIGYGSNQRALYSNEQATYLDKKVQSTSKLKEVAITADAGNGFASGAPESANYKVAYDNIGQSNVSSLQSFQGSRSLYNNGRLYNTMGDEIVCTDSSGKVKWKHKLDGDLNDEGGYLGTPPVYVNGFIIVATLKGEVLVFNKSDGAISRKYNVKDGVRYQPVVDKGWIYVTTVNSKLYAINTGNAKMTGWNMWGGNAARTNVGKKM